MTHCGAFQPVLFCDHLPCCAHLGCQAGNAPERGFLSRLFTDALRALQNGRLTQPVVVEPCHTQFTVLDYLLSQEVSLVVTPWLGSTRVARTLWHLHSVLEYASFKSGFFYNSPLLLIVDSFPILKWAGGSFFKLTPQSSLTWDAEFLGLLH